MLAAMVESWVLWVLLVGLVVGGALTWLVMVRLPRREDDVSRAERPAEAAWISHVIERNGGIAPASLVEEVLDLHQAYLADTHLARLPTRTQRNEALSLPPALPGWPVVTAASMPPAGQPALTSPAPPPPGARPAPGTPAPQPPGGPAPPGSSTAFTPPPSPPPAGRR